MIFLLLRIFLVRVLVRLSHENWMKRQKKGHTIMMEKKKKNIRRLWTHSTGKKKNENFIFFLSSSDVVDKKDPKYKRCHGQRQRHTISPKMYGKLLCLCALTKHYLIFIENAICLCHRWDFLRFFRRKLTL